MNVDRLRGAWRALMPHVTPEGLRARRHPAAESGAVEGWETRDSVWQFRGQQGSDLLRAASVPQWRVAQESRFKQMSGDRSALQFLRAVLRFHSMRWSMVASLTRNHAQWAGRLGDEPFSTLEVGTNVGLMSMAVKQQLPQARVVGVDLRPRFIELAQWYEEVMGKPGVEWKVTDGSSLTQSLPGERFNVVYLCEILEHYKMDDEEGRAVQLDLLAQASAMCKPGGWVFVSVPFEDRIPLDGHLTHFTYDSLDSIVRPFASQVVWFAQERLRYHLDNHFFLAFKPNAEQQSAEP